jgi:hypothetical protein
MDRRAFLAGTGAMVFGGAALANNMQLGPPSPMGIPRRAWVNQPTVIRQNCPLWCWAASAAMIFASNGRPLQGQEVIIDRVFRGNRVCTTGMPSTISQLLSAGWVDSAGRPFQSRLVANYDIFSGIVAMNNAIIVQELSQNRPLLYCNKHHAMVVVSVDYFETPMGPNVQQVMVMDPWPGSPAFHPLSQAEMVPAHMGGDYSYLAAVQLA